MSSRPLFLRATQGARKVKIMQITCKKGGEIGAREEKGRRQRFFMSFELPVSAKQKFRLVGY